MITRALPILAGFLAIILGGFPGSSGAMDLFSTTQTPQAAQTARASEPLLPDRMQTLYVIPEAVRAPANPVRQASFHQPAATAAPRVAAPVRQAQPAPAPLPTSRQFDPQAMVAGNPFDYDRGGSGNSSDDTDGGFYPTKLVSLPPEIQLVGILMLKDRDAIAAIRFPGTGKQLGEVHYVREGDDIEIPASLLRPAGRQPKAAAQVAEIDEIVYLKVRKITPQHVEVSSQSNMADRHFLR